MTGAKQRVAGRGRRVGSETRSAVTARLPRMQTFDQLAQTKWAGIAELWLDPLGDEVVRSECTLWVEPEAVRYAWSYEGKSQQGSFTLREGGADFTDSWHQPEPMACRTVAGGRGLFYVQGEYGPDSDWGWRTTLSLRAPTGPLVLQMTNIAPWGEEVRAVRLICTRATD